MSCERECSVCYGESGPFVKLCCGHEFCTGCVKAWYLKGTGTGCPMCRRPMYFRGFHKMQDQWNEDSWEGRCADIFGEALQERISEFIDTIEEDCDILNEQDDNEDAAWLAIDLLDSDDPRITMKFMDETEDFEFKSEVIALYRKYQYEELKREVIRIERTYRFLKSECVSSEDMEEILVYSNDYYSDRSIDKWVWNDEPVKEFATKYPVKAVGTRGGKRCRAREDPWAEMSFYILV